MSEMMVDGQLVPMSQKDTDQQKADGVMYATMLASSVRSLRDARLSACDWTQVADAPVTDAQRKAWQDYRTALRGVPQQAGFPAAVTWPIEPS